MNVQTLVAAQEHLSACDERMSELIGHHGSWHYEAGEPFDVLTYSIVGQQLSVRAAKTIRRRVLALTGNRKRFDANELVGVSRQQLRDAGLSRAKAKALALLAESVVAGELDFSSFASMADDEVVKILCRHIGIGRWTAEMFLIFALGRPDVLSSGDLGLRRAAQAVYSLEERPDAETFAELGKHWRPYRSVASWYLWKVVD